MRKEPYGIGSYVHVIKRGTRGLPIVHDKDDRRRFLLMLRHFNDTHQPSDWFQDVRNEKLEDTLERPERWPTQNKLVNILTFCLLDNHFHLLLKETREGGISIFMQRLGTGLARYYNEKYQQQGSIFQGSYRSKTIHDTNYLKSVSAYIQVKNAFEMFPGGYEKAKNNFDKAFTWALEYPYCSLGNYAGNLSSPIIDGDVLQEIIHSKEYKKFSKEFVEGRRPAEVANDEIPFE